MRFFYQSFGHYVEVPDKKINPTEKKPTGDVAEARSSGLIRETRKLYRILARR